MPGVFARNLLTYNERVAQRGSDEAALPLILVVIDEVSDIALQCGLRSAFYKNLIRLSSKGAAFGLILVLATQNPKAEVLNTLIRGNMSTRIAFRVSSAEHSRTILGTGGAQKLPRTIRGRMLARLDESLVELQGFYVSDEAVLALAQRWAASRGRAALARRARAGGLCARRAGGRLSRRAAVRAVQGPRSRTANWPSWAGAGSTMAGCRRPPRWSRRGR